MRSEFSVEITACIKFNPRTLVTGSTIKVISIGGNAERASEPIGPFLVGEGENGFGRKRMMTFSVGLGSEPTAVVKIRDILGTDVEKERTASAKRILLWEPSVEEGGWEWS
jgi:hypothetical protein